jgi:phytoene dehydrogenase-like protein
MRRFDRDIVIIGAGVAGLAATVKLKSAGKDVICLEAASRIGGRIFNRPRSGFARSYRTRRRIRTRASA